MIRNGSDTNRDLGTRFEQLMVQYLRTDPTMEQRFSQVWMWADWPGADGDKRDVGIDLVAQERQTGELCAIQCKFYEPHHTIQKADIDSFFTASGKGDFAYRMIISTTEKWGPHAEAALDGQQIPVTRVGLAEINESPVDWASIVWPKPGENFELRLQHKKTPRPHQDEAIDAVFAGFEGHDRGKLIMACGTGKTFTGLKIVERLQQERAERGEGEHTRILFLVPSIALLSQTLREWTAQVQVPMNSFAVCSDTKVSKQAAASDFQDMSTHDLAFPATTSPAKLIEQMASVEAGPGLTVVFSTYQSIAAVAQAQQAGLGEFDLILCDEAHRTTGVSLVKGDGTLDESNFVKVHNNDYIKAARRLYMTATPRIFSDDTKTDAKQQEATLASMDDETLFGPEFHRLGFGKAVEQGLLTDYKVLILTVDEEYAAASLQQQLADQNSELSTLDDAVKIIGCWNGLAKRTGTFADGSGFQEGEAPMKRAVAFAKNIADSKKITDLFAEVVDAYDGTDEDILHCEIRHVDGTYNALRRHELLDWLKQDPGENKARILSNARCLSEGVDVPDLDSVLFLHPRNSVVDVVQSVGRVMRKADDKQYGYIILPVGIPAGTPPEKALADNKRFKTVWQVLNALRAHDDRFNATVNQLELNKKRPDNIMVGHAGPETESLGDGSPQGEADAARWVQGAFDVEDWRKAIYARIVIKCGERQYWEDWAQDIAQIAEKHKARIKAALQLPEKEAAFETFVEELRASINPGITGTDALDMLAQHIITKPVFDALFKDYAFSEHNPVSQAMQRMLDTLEDQAIGEEAKKLDAFYESVRVRAEGIDNHEGRQRVITELYEKFFKTALPKTADALGIVYTPVEVVDFILRATNQALSKYFGSSLSDEGVHIIDPFTGTGTFVVRLLQSGLIKPEDLLRKYASELHANEIVLLAYYIAAVNIEAAFHDEYEGEDYVPFEGIVLTDTFQLAESNAEKLFGVLEGNSERVKKQQAQDIRVVIGNPPYSAGQESQNDGNQNLKYEALDEHIRTTYAAKSVATNKNSLYDSYIRAIRWASDRVKDEGVICFVSNGGYIDGSTADGLRKSLIEEFDALYCYNLRGNQRTAGEQSQKEGGKIFGSGSRSTVAILLLVKGGTAAGAGGELHYRDIGDCLDRERKLAIIASQNLGSVEWEQITPSSEGDWINQRDERFYEFPAIGEKRSRGASPQATVFSTYSAGLQANRDAWVCNFSKERASVNSKRMISFYNSQVDSFKEYCESTGVPSPKSAVDGFIERDPKLISWTRSLKGYLAKFEKTQFRPDGMRVGAYRAFTKDWVYFNKHLNHERSKLPQFFPESSSHNFGIFMTGVAAAMQFTPLAVSGIPDASSFGGQTNGQFFPRYTYREPDMEGVLPLGDEGDGCERIDNITDAALRDFRKTYVDETITKDDIFYYVYGLLHSTTYCKQFAADLKKSLPRIPKVDSFRGFAEAGRNLVDLHLDYESVKPYAGIVEKVTGAEGTPPSELYRVSAKMKFPSRKGEKDKTTIIFNSHVTLSNIPQDAYRYQLGARSAIEWIIDRYYVKTDKASGIVNDPNDWSDDPRYIIDLLKRIVTVSLETMKIVDGLPPLDILE
ncbi:damage-inducible protein [Streptomyces qinglanensis]|uniref:Damage-inducible protein n=2 Tax=Streptomyces qinglanensis TaxID=943816 RepID=A0A1E7KCJ2_9ACTN|nr:damage-inducible protein [Streptomyces qinglanensis]OEV07053.1 damage-inducible protein [Streptomyces nanshensis]